MRHHFASKLVMAGVDLNTVRDDIEKIREQRALTPDFIFRDPYFLKFTGLASGHSENDLENSILNELTSFLQELGDDFCFVARQKRMGTENTERTFDITYFLA